MDEKKEKKQDGTVAAWEESKRNTKVNFEDLNFIILLMSAAFLYQAYITLKITISL